MDGLQPMVQLLRCTLKRGVPCHLPTFPEVVTGLVTSGDVATFDSIWITRGPLAASKAASVVGTVGCLTADAVTDSG